MRIAIVCCVLLVCGVCVADPIIPAKYPLFAQCDPRWGNDFMGGNDTLWDVICAQGCAMSSLSMLLNGKGYTIDGKPSDPGTLNHWLRNNGGYTTIDGDPDNLVLDAPDKLAPNGDIQFLSEVEKPAVDVMKGMIDNQNPMAIAHVNNKTHFVLVVGYDTYYKDIFYVHDPFFNRNNYSWSEMADLLLYHVADNL